LGQDTGNIAHGATQGIAAGEKEPIDQFFHKGRSRWHEKGLNKLLDCLVFVCLCHYLCSFGRYACSSKQATPQSDYANKVHW
jgi:hypothetical protein